MEACEFIDKCPFFHGELAEKPVEIEKMKLKYCRSNNLNCARYLIAIALGKSYMPNDLYPHEKEVAFSLISEHG